MLNNKFYDKHPILHPFSKYPVNVQSVQIANDQLMTVMEANKFLISFEGHTFKIIVTFLASFDFIFRLKTMTEIERKSKYLQIGSQI